MGTTLSRNSDMGSNKEKSKVAVKEASSKEVTSTTPSIVKISIKKKKNFDQKTKTFEQNSDKEDKKPFMCNLCEYSFVNIEALTIHISTVHESNEKSDHSEKEDDPNKLWCICQKPHGNRFMICCDACSYWYHGTCIGITKKNGKEMEKAGQDWTCQKCADKDEKKA